MLNALLVAVGGAAGSLARYAAGLAGQRLFGGGFPFGVLFVNLTGSFLIGLGAELLARRFGAAPELRLLLLTGFLGGYTTFSTFSLDAIVLYERGEIPAAILYVLVSVIVGLAAVVAGVALGRQFG